MRTDSSPSVASVHIARQAALGEMPELLPRSLTAYYGHMPISIKSVKEQRIQMLQKETLVDGLFLNEPICNATALRKATRRVSQLYDAVLAPCGLRSTQRSILIYIAQAETLSIGDLAAALVLDRSALAHNLKPLERDGFVAVSADPADKRSRQVTLTTRGQTKLAKSQVLWENAQHRFETVFGAEQAQALRQALALIASSHFTRAFREAG